MQRQSKSVRLVSDDGSVIVVNPDHGGNAEPVTLEVTDPGGDHGTRVTALAEMDGETADALADAIDEARGRRKRQRAGRDGSE